MKGRELVLQGPIRRVLFVLAGPVILGELFHTAFHIVDLFWVGPLGAWATAAIATSIFTIWTGLSLANLVMTGVAAHVSRAIGEGDRERAGHVVAQALWACVFLGVFVMVVGGSGAGLLFRLLGTEPRITEAGTAYLRVIALGMPLSFLYLTCGAVMRACGNTRTPMKVTASFVVVNALLAPLLIYGIGPFPALGVPGSAIATVASMGGAALVYGLLFMRRHPDLPLSMRSLRRIDLAIIGSLARVGAPYCAIGVLFSCVYLWYAHIATAFGEASLALIGIGNRLESITYLSADGFAAAASTFVGQNLGARNTARAEQGAWRAVRIMSMIGGGIGVVLAMFPGPLLAIFTQDPEAIRLGVPYLRILAICQIFTGLEGAIGGGFAGAGDTVPPMVIHVVFALARIPLAYWAAFALGLGVFGVAWTMSLTCVLRAVILAFWFRLGRWKKKKLTGAVRPLPPSDEPEPTGV